MQTPSRNVNGLLYPCLSLLLFSQKVHAEQGFMSLFIWGRGVPPRMDNSSKLQKQIFGVVKSASSTLVRKTSAPQLSKVWKALFQFIFHAFVECNNRASFNKQMKYRTFKFKIYFLLFPFYLKICLYNVVWVQRIPLLSFYCCCLHYYTSQNGSTDITCTSKWSGSHLKLSAFNYYYI